MASADVLTAGGVELNTTRLATFLAVPEDDVVALSNLAEEYVASILKAINAKANEFDELKADKLKADIELEQTVRTADSRVKSMKGQLDSALAETQELRQKLSMTETARATLENEFAAYKTSRTTVDEETRTLRVRVSTLESDKRDALETLDRKCGDYDKLQEEYATTQQKAITMRREFSAMETKLQQAESAQSNAKFRVQSLEQELNMVKKNNEWLDSELKTKTADHQKFRKEKAAQISRLNSELEEAKSEVEMLKRSVETLKERLQDVSKKAEDRLLQITELQGSAAAQEESFRQEINAQRRLAELFERSMNTSKARVAEVERILEHETERVNIDLGQAHALAETERNEREIAEKKIAELEVEIERLESELASYAAGVVAMPGSASPQGSANGLSTPARQTGVKVATPGSAAMFSPAASRLLKSGISITQLYSDYNQVKASYENEKRRNVKLEEAMQDIVNELEEKAPEIEELREEKTRIEKDLVEMSKFLEETIKERDQAKRETRKTNAKIADFEREAAILRQQLRDLSTQVQVLVVEIESRDAGIERLNAHQNRIYEEIINGNLTIEGQNDTDNLITQRLVVFRNLQEMQEQNANLLRAIRELGAKMETEEQERLKSKEVQENEEIQRLEGVVQRLQDEMKSIALKSQTFIRERNMFRQMLQNKGQLNEDTQMQSPGRMASEDGVSVVEMQNMAETLRNLQTQYDQYKNDTLETQNTINEQNRRLMTEKSELEIQVARINSQLEMAAERYDMLNGNFNMLRGENQELQKRLTYMHEAQAKQDMKTQQAIEELVDVKSLNESMRTENANLKAEKSLWKSIEERLSADNESLTQERARLNALISNLQSIQSEHERTDSEARRRLTSQCEKLENELQATKRRLNDEIEQTKKNLIRKEMDQKEAQRRYDELNTSYGAVKEELVAAKTSRDHLQTRVNELTVDLKNVEEKLAVYRDKPVAVEKSAEDNAEIIEELQLQAADLKKELEVKNSELQDAREQVEQFKAISLANEEQLEELQASYDQFKESMDAEVEQRENTIRDLQQRIEDMSTEHSSINQELSELRKAELEKLQEFEAEKGMLLSQLNSIKEDFEKAQATATYHQEDLRRQASIAQEAQQNYERELVKHADAAKALQELRTEHAALKNTVHTIQTEAESARAALLFNEGSWETQRENYKKELSDLRARCDDLIKQNKILHGQFESVSEQVANLQKERSYADEALASAPEGQSADKSMDDLREVVRYLRNEKELVDAKFELSVQESKRLKQQLDYTRNQLDETRVQLATEQRKQDDQLRGAAEHKEIMEKISELNLLRESNSTLRFEGEKKGKRVAELTATVEQLEAKIQPLEQAVRELEAEKEVKDAQMKLLSEDNERWKARTQQILQKYDRVDPAELEELKQKAADLETKATALETERDELAQKLAASDSDKEIQSTTWRNKLNKMRDDANTKITTQRNKALELATEIEGLRAQLEEANSARDQAATNGNEELQRLVDDKARLEAEIAGLKKRVSEMEATIESHKANSQTLLNKSIEAKKEKEQLAVDLNNLKAELGVTQSQLVAANTQIESLTAQIAAKNEDGTEEGAVTEGAAKIDPALIEAELKRRLAEVQPQQTGVDPALVEEEVQRRMAEWQFEQTKAGTAATCDHAAEIDLIVQQRVAEATAAIEANVEAQVQQRLAERSASAPGNGETVNTAQPVPAPADVDPAQATAMVSQLSEEEIDARVNARVEELLPARVDAIVAERIVAKEQAVDQRIRTAQAKFAEYKASAVKKAVEEAEAKFKVERDEYQTKISGLEAEISRLGMLIQQLRAKIAELEASKNTVKEESESTGIQQEDLDAALAQKEEEHQAAIEALKSAEAENIDKAKDELRVEIQAEILSAQLAIDAMTPEEGAAAVNKEREKLKTVISRNVEHRLSKEKEKWLQEIATERETIVNSKVQAVLAEKVTELEAKMQEREAALKLEMEKAKDAVRAESVMRSKVQINMLERKNKQLEEKVKALEGGQPSVPATPAAAAASHAAPASAQAPTPTVTPATTATTAAPQVLQTGIRRPSAIGTPASVPSTRPEPPTAGQIQAAQQAAIAAAEQTIAGTPPNAQQTQQRRQDSQGTGPQALRQLRGALAGTGIPRGGMVAGRGRGGIPQPGSIAGAPVTQIPATNTFIGVPGATPPGILNPFAGATQQPPQAVQGQQQATRGGGIPRGRGYAGRGRGGTQHVQTAGMQQQAQQNASSPTRGVMNPGARQFVPGGKRGREGEGDDGADGKRARNSTGGAPPPAQQ